MNGHGSDADATTTTTARGSDHQDQHDQHDRRDPRPDEAEQGQRRARLGRRAQLLAGVSVAYNLIEAAVAITAGSVASSSALIAFGLDSTVEVFSGVVVLWQFRHAVPESRERLALRLMAVGFFALAAWVAVDSIRALTGAGEADPSIVGIVLAGLSVVVMPWLSWAQRRTGRALGSGSVIADSTQTLLCTYLSAVLLVGLVLNATLGWSWADPIAALVIAAVAVREGREAWRGESCCATDTGANAGVQTTASTATDTGTDTGNPGLA
jgi:divalent metal cation (Fe/Co/Zn/Cd) transporter